MFQFPFCLANEDDLISFHAFDNKVQIPKGLHKEVNNRISDQSQGQKTFPDGG